MAKNQATNANAEAGIPDTSNWEQVQTQFPPFWVPSEGARFYAKYLGKDDSNPDFERNVFQALSRVPCHRGPREQGEDVMVEAGDLFTVSVYATLRLGPEHSGLDMVVRCTGQIEAKTPAGFVWGFKVQLHPESSKLLHERKAQLAVSSPNPL